MIVMKRIIFLFLFVERQFVVQALVDRLGHCQGTVVEL